MKYIKASPHRSTDAVDWPFKATNYEKCVTLNNYISQSQIAFGNPMKVKILSKIV